MKAHEKITVSLAGSGNVGSFLAGELFKAGVQIKQIYSRTLANAQALATKVNAEAIDSIESIDTDVDLLIIALPDHVIPEFSKILSSIYFAKAEPDIESQVDKAKSENHNSDAKADNAVADSSGSDKPLRGTSGSEMPVAGTSGTEMPVAGTSGSNLLVASTSGSVHINEISKYFTKCGVLYPLQSFTLKTNPDPHTVPFCIEATDWETAELLRHLASLISKDVRDVDSDQRILIHMAAVFASNFTNHMIAIAEDVINKAEQNFDILRPLITETIDRLSKFSPSEVQTGPAVRDDKETLDKHIELLGSLAKKELSDIYSLISESILKKKNKP